MPTARTHPSPFDDLLGLVYGTMEPDEVTATLMVDDRHLQPVRIVHGGVFCAIVESVGSVGALQWLETRDGALDDGPDAVPVGVSNHTQFLRPAHAGEQLAARGRPLHRGRSLQLWRVEINGPEGDLRAHGTLRVFNLPRSGGQASSS